jgi:hypothetical protein
MELNYFESRKPFDFSPHPFDAGDILGLKRGIRQQPFFTQSIWGG